MLEHRTLDHPAFVALSAYAKETLLFLARRYGGSHRALIEASHRYIAKGTRRSEDRVAKSLRELEDAGFIHAVRRGCMGVEGAGRGTAWRVTFLAADGVGITREFETIWTQKKTEARPAERGKERPAVRGKGKTGKAIGAPLHGASKGENGRSGAPPRGAIYRSCQGPCGDGQCIFSACLPRGDWMGEPRTFAVTRDRVPIRVGTRVAMTGRGDE